MITVGIKAIPMSDTPDFAHNACIDQRVVTETMAQLLSKMIDLAESITGHRPCEMTLEINWLDADNPSDTAPTSLPFPSPLTPKDKNVH